MKRVSPSELEEVTEGPDSFLTSPFDWTIDIIDEPPCHARLGGVSPVASDLDPTEKIDKDRKRNVKSGRASLRRKKKPKGMPKRPLSAYNIFFQLERTKIVDENNKERNYHSSVAKLTFEQLGKIIGKRWKALGEEDRKEFDKLADAEGSRYRKEMEAYNEAKRRRRAEKIVQLERPLTIGAAQVSAESDSTPETPRGQKENSEAPPPLSAFPLEPTTPVKARLPRSNHDGPSQGGCEQIPVLHSPSTARSVASMPLYPPPSWQRPTVRGYHPLSGIGLPEPRFEAPTLSVASQPRPRSSLPVPPGMELFLPDSSGQDRRYVVQYSFYKMSRREAEAYMQSLESSARSAPLSPHSADVVTAPSFSSSSSIPISQISPPPPYSSLLNSHLSPQSHGYVHRYGAMYKLETLSNYFLFSILWHTIQPALSSKSVVYI